MCPVVLNDETMRCISLFENITRTQVKDCIIKEDKLIFIIPKNQVVYAVGKYGENIKRLKELYKKNIDIIGFSTELELFVRNVFHNFKIQEVRVENRGEKSFVHVNVDLREKGKIIGKNGQNLKLAKEIVARHFDVADIIIA
ncbi:MAG: NusA-like transcription termination signal-binding factor [Thermoplasmata archaeon]|nr:MAG: NusA-like transcription termination signal-binding factor [Thermoplasmata archaeon]